MLKIVIPFEIGINDASPMQIARAIEGTLCEIRRGPRRAARTNFSHTDSQKAQLHTFTNSLHYNRREIN